MQPLLQGEPVCAGIDWITVTQRPSEEMEHLREQAFALAAVELSRGMFGKPWRASGYEGFIVGGVSYGERSDGCILQLTSALAAAHWRRAYEASCSVTRIDLQVTVLTNRDPYDVISKHIKELGQKNAKLKKPRKLRVSLDYPKALTVYSGHPASDRMGRIYDKGRESNEKSFQGCVRYELVLRNKKAKAVGFGLWSKGANASQVALRSLAFFAERGCCVRSLMAKFDRLASIDEPRYPVGPSDIEKKLRWIQTAVRPSVLLLAERLGKPAMQELLGLH